MGIGLNAAQNNTHSDGYQRQQSTGTQGSQSTQTSNNLQTTTGQLQNYYNQLDSMSGGRLSNWATTGTPQTNYDMSYGLTKVPYEGDVSGRVQSLLQSASPVSYQGVSADQVKALGGMGSTRTLAANQVYADAADKLRADPSMTLAQRQYASGLNTRELAQTRDAIGQETEAAITKMAQEEALRQYTAGAADRQAAMSGQETALTAEQEQYGRQYTANAADRTAAMEAANLDYQARLANSQLTRQDMATLGELLARFMGNNSSSSGQSTSYGQNESFGQGFNNSVGHSFDYGLKLGLGGAGGGN